MSTQQDTSRNFPSWWVIGRDMLLFAGGLYFGYEELARQEVRDTVLVLVGGMLGLPAMLHGGQSLVDSIMSGRGGQQGPSSSPEPPAPPSVSP